MTKRSPNEFISEVEAQKLLDALCTESGFCLSPLWQARLTKNPPQSIDKFTETVFLAEGLDPVLADRTLYRSIHEAVREAFERSTPRPTKL